MVFGCIDLSSSVVDRSRIAFFLQGKEIFLSVVFLNDQEVVWDPLAGSFVYFVDLSFV